MNLSDSRVCSRTFDCRQFKRTISIEYWSHSSVLWLPAWLQMINAAARSQTTRTGSQMDEELCAADYKRGTGGMRRRRRRRKESESPPDDSSPQAASQIWCQHSGFSNTSAVQKPSTSSVILCRGLEFRSLGWLTSQISSLETRF